MASLRIAENRRGRKWSRRVNLARVLWAVAHPLFAFSPRIFWAWRRGLLRLFGARIGRATHVYPTVRITMPWNLEIGDESGVGDRVIIYALGQVRIGNQTTISQGAHLCAGTHDYRRPDLPLVKLPITIGNGCWICADAFIGPNVTIADFAIVGARGVVVSDIPGRTIVGGNPARLLRHRPDFGNP
jgi:putative colanic acid biosynthesis acetyltransferase WcaF